MSMRQGGNTIAGLQDISGKADTDLSNVLANIDFVVERQDPTAENNYTWYRKYKSGWVEQGGSNISSSGTATVVLPVAMADTHYTATSSIIYSGTSTGTIGAQISKGQTQIIIGARFNGAFNNGLSVDWQVSGMAAS